MNRSNERTIERHEILWRDILILVEFERDAFGQSGDLHHVSHLQVRSLAKGRALPVSETGYRSHFLHPEQVDAHGGPVAYATQWLDASAKLPAWKHVEAEQRQGSLF